MKHFALILMSLFAATALAEDVFVAQPSASIRSGKGAAYDELAKLKKGEKMTVIAREGKWLKVNANGKEGWVFETSISATKPGANLFNLGGSDASGASATAAGRGLGESKEYAKSKGMSLKGLDRMIALTNAVSGDEQVAFEKDGKVGSGKP